MVFSSYIFILFFLPVVLLIYYILSKVKNNSYQKNFLIVASLFFYAYYNISYVLLILVSIISNYIVALCMEKYEKYSKVLFLIGILFNIGLIGYFKYFNFFVENINIITGSEFILKNIILPLGISFFTFQQISFLVSIYKKECKLEKFRDYTLFVVFFPQLVAGPIVSYNEMMPQFKDEKTLYFNSKNFALGIYAFSIGLLKKVFIADTLAHFVENGYGIEEIGLSAAWLTALSYTLQIYFDFSGYSDMAIGIGKMFNITLPYNFMSPYKSQSISEFWRKWNITLGKFLSTCIYIPLGGNKKGIKRTCINLLITFFISGLWHGAAWTFILWGLLHGVFVVLERILGKILNKIPRCIRILYTFLVVNFLFVLFRANDISSALEMYKGMFNFENIGIEQLDTLVGVFTGINFPLLVDIIYINLIIVSLLFVIFKFKNSASCIKEFKVNKSTLLTTIFMFLIAFLCLSRHTIFIYFNF